MSARTFNEDTVYTFSSSDFAFSDPSDAKPPSSINPNTILNVIISSLPTNGSLADGATPINFGAVQRAVRSYLQRPAEVHAQYGPGIERHAHAQL